MKTNHKLDRDLYNMLKKSAEADIAKAKLTMKLLSDKAVGIGDHSTEDFYKNAEEALSMLADAKDRIEALEELNGWEGLGLDDA